jgi:hypothetical protein
MLYLQVTPSFAPLRVILTPLRWPVDNNTVRVFSYLHTPYVIGVPDLADRTQP